MDNCKREVDPEHMSSKRLLKGRYWPCTAYFVCRRW